MLREATKQEIEVLKRREATLQLELPLTTQPFHDREVVLREEGDV